ncbi:nibrin [Clonorchis sinensis]|uniref:Nibrin n=1 Tax=Clonorchis sinensis TaxID=79923 RepID=G7Y5C7_CLOSI|nr:nibrin [Clonorchis sinensis]
MIAVSVPMEGSAAAQTAANNVHGTNFAFQLLVLMWEFIQIGKHSDLQETVLNIAVSSMNKAERQRIKAITNLLHGELVPTCTDACAFLVMPHLVVTVKENFLPPVREERLVDSDAIRFLPNDKRPSLFKGKVFYVLTHAHFSELSPIVRLGGGKVVLIDSSEAFVQHYEEQSGTCGNVERDLQEVLQREGSCVIHAQNAPGLENWQRVVYSVLRGIRRRPILESELGFAVLYISTNGYCNPETKCQLKVQNAITIIELTAPSLTSYIRLQTSGDLDTSSAGHAEPDILVGHRAEASLLDWMGIPCIPKSKCLVADSETMFHSPGNTEKHHPLSVCSEQSNVNDHTIIQSKNMVKPTELMKENIAPLFRETDKNPADELIPQTSLCHQTENFIDEQDALAALNSMPSLFPLQIPRASVTSTRRGILKDLSPSNEADLSNPDSSTVSADPKPAICNQAELRKLQLSSASSPNSVIQQRTSSPMNATHPSSVGLAGWLSKNALMTPTDSDNMLSHTLSISLVTVDGVSAGLSHDQATAVDGADVSATEVPTAQMSILQLTRYELVDAIRHQQRF